VFNDFSFLSSRSFRRQGISGWTVQHSLVLPESEFDMNKANSDKKIVLESLRTLDE
jgi:hypothetical protein